MTTAISSDDKDCSGLQGLAAPVAWAILSDRHRPPARWLAAVALAMLCFVLFVLWQTPNSMTGMYANIDGYWAAWNHEALFRWGRPFDLSPFNPLGGMGSQFLPNLPWLNPAAWPLALPWAQDLRYALSYAIYFLELMGSSYLLFRCIGVSRILAFVAAQFLVLVFFPPFSQYTNTLDWYAMAPVNAHLAAMCNLALAALLRLGEGGWRRDLGWAALFAAAILSALYSGPITVLTYVPVYGMFLVLLLAGRKPRRRAILVKSATILAMALFLAGIGFVDYVAATSAMSARTTTAYPFGYLGAEMLKLSFWRSVNNVCEQGQDLQFLMCGGPFLWLQGLALLGAVGAIALVPVLRAAGIGYLLLVAGVHLLALGRVPQAFGTLSQINAAFFLWAALSFLSLFAVIPAALVLDRAGRLLPRPAGMPAGHPVAMLAVLAMVPALMVAIWYGAVARNQPPPPAGKPGIGLLPPAATPWRVLDGPIYSALRERAALAPGLPFRGRAAVIFPEEGWVAGQFPGLRDYEVAIASRTRLDAIFGSNFQEMDLWSQGIPTLGEYGQWVSRPAMRLVQATLALPRRGNAPSLLRATRLDLPVLRLLGVRFLITDVAVAGPGVTRLASQTAPDAPGVLYLYELAGANLADYSPTDIQVAASYQEALDWIARHAGEATGRGVSFTAPQGPLVPADRARLTFVRDGWRLQAASSGRSVLAVPVQFTHCWALEGAPDSVRLYRGNALQTFVEFEGEIDILARFRYGPFIATDCRARDARDLRELGL